ncbi:MAG: NUDIX domain-containing protein [Lactobacillaceae bacterium]|jgi:hypothetical protein|nr:NUDIX domain-containing protein [Lactobacillaceae bacterium]
MNEIDFLINEYKPYDALENKHIARLRHFTSHKENIYERSNDGSGCITASCIVVNEDMTKVLVMHHILHDFYKQFGGHADNNPNLAEVALTELKEEGHLDGKLLSGKPIDFVIWSFGEHVKNGTTIPQHLIYDAAFLVQIPENCVPKVAPDEGFDIKWISMEEWRDMKFDPNNSVIKDNPHNSHYNKRIYEKVMDFRLGRQFLREKNKKYKD